MQSEFTPTEAAAITELPLKYIQKAIDDGPLRAARRKDRVLDFEDLVFLYTVGHIDSGLIQLSASAKKQLRRKINASSADLEIGGCRFQLKPALRAVRLRLAKLNQARRMVVRNPEIRGGLPVIKGTRIGVYEVAAMLEYETNEAEFLEDYPSLTAGNLELSKIYAAAYPKRGRPPRHPWHVAKHGEQAAA